jgi:hypothetical protein
LAINSGEPSTDLKALTGELTPPGNIVFAVSKSWSEFLREIIGFRLIGVCIFVWLAATGLK